MTKRTVVAHLTVGLVPATVLLVCLFLAKQALAAKPEYEVVCRSKAKDAATEIYKTCVTENKNSQIDSLKKEYQDKLKAMKDDYEKELSRIAGKQVSMKEPSAATVAAPAKAAAKKGKAAAAKAAKKNGKRTIIVPIQPSAPVADEVLETRTVPTDEFDGSSMDIPEPIPVYVPEEQLPETY